MMDDLRARVQRFLMSEKIKKFRQQQRDMEMRAAIMDAKEKQLELEMRFNHNHDPKNGRFCSGNGSSTGLTSSGIRDRISKRKKSNVNTGGIRNEDPLTNKQIQDCIDYARELGFQEDIAYSSFSNTAFICSTEGEKYCRLVIGTDAYPNPKAKTVNGKLSYRAAIAHEIVGHYEAWNGGFSLDGVLEEAQASIRAGRFAPGLTDGERISLYRDELIRLRKSNIKLKDARKHMRIDRR